MEFKVKGIFVKTLLIILAVSFVLFGIINFFSGVGQTNIFKVGNEKVSVNRFVKFLNDKRSQVYQSNLSDEELNFLNSRQFINASLNEFVNEILFQNEIKKLGLEEPREAVIMEIYNDPLFKEANGKFDINVFRDALSRSNLTEEDYITYISVYNSRNNLFQLLNAQKLANDFVLRPLFLETNKYVVADIIAVNPKSLKSKAQKPSEEEIEEYYNKNKSSFVVPEEKIISYVEIDLSKYRGEEAKAKLSELEDLILSSKNIDEVVAKFNTKKQTVRYSENSKQIPQDLDADVLQYDIGTFSDLIYKDNSLYKVYYVEDIVASKVLTLAEATSQISAILEEQSKNYSDIAALKKLILDIKNNGISKVSSNSNFMLTKNKSIYRMDLEYPDGLVDGLYSLRDGNKVTEPVFDSDKGVYLVGCLKEVKEMPETDSRFVSMDGLRNRINRSCNNSVAKLFQKYLFDTESIIINNRLLDSLE